MLTLIPTNIITYSYNKNGENYKSIEIKQISIFPFFISRPLIVFYSTVEKLSNLLLLILSIMNSKIHVQSFSLKLSKNLDTLPYPSKKQS